MLVQKIFQGGEMKRNILAVLMVVTMLLCLAPASMAADAPKVLDSDTVSDVLKRYVGKRVELVLVSGDRLTGRIEKVTPRVIHISSLKGMDFYDAVVRVESIASVIVRARG
jgi:hypothetical protein